MRVIGKSTCRGRQSVLRWIARLRFVASGGAASRKPWVSATGGPPAPYSPLTLWNQLPQGLVGDRDLFGSVEFDLDVSEDVFTITHFPHSELERASTEQCSGSIELNLAGSQPPSQQSWLLRQFEKRGRADSE